MLNCIHLSCQCYWSPREKKHLISMKNSCLHDERWNPNNDVVGDIGKNITNMVFDAWWRQSWFRRSRFVSMFFHSLWRLVGKCAKFLRPCNITKSRLVSRLRFFFLHLTMSPNDDNFFIRAKCLECHSNRSILFLFLPWSSFSRWKFILFCFFSVIRSTSC